MAADLKDEFEIYVKKLTTAICKDIFLEKLDELCSKYQSEYNKYAKATEQAVSASDLMKKEVQTVDKSVKNIEKQTRSSLRVISDDIDKMEASIESMFEEMRTLNLQNRSDFISELGSYIEKYKTDVADVFADGCNKISDKLAGVITPEIMQQFLDSLEENTRESKEIAGFINNTYKDEIEENIKLIVEKSRLAQSQVNQVISLSIKKITDQLVKEVQKTESSINEKAQECSDIIGRQVSILAKYMKKMLDEEGEKRKESLEEQKELIKQIQPSEKRLEKFEDRVFALEQIIRGMERKNTANSELIRETLSNYMNEQKELEQNWRDDMNSIEKKADNLSWKMYIVFSNTFILFLFVLQVVLLKPWRMFGIVNTIIIACIFFIIMIFGAVIRRHVAKAVITIKETDAINSYINKKLGGN